MAISPRHGIPRRRRRSFCPYGRRVKRYERHHFAQRSHNASLELHHPDLPQVPGECGHSNVTGGCQSESAWCRIVRYQRTWASSRHAWPLSIRSRDEPTRRTSTRTIEMKPGMGPGAFYRESESVVRQLQAGHTVTVEMKIRTSDRIGHARSVGILERLVSLAEGVGEVQLLDIGERVRPRVVLVPIPQPPSAQSSVPASPKMPH
jgi:hypothetical protein